MFSIEQVVVNLSPLSFFRSLRPDKKQFAVIGLGRFGRSVSSTLTQFGYEVLGIDRSEELVDQALVEKIASHCLQVDSTKFLALKEAGVFEFDTVVVAIGNYIEESIITTLNLKEGGVKHVVAKASSEVHSALLHKVGADRVIFPEQEMGRNLAQSLTNTGIIGRFEVDPDHSIVEVRVPKEFDNKTILELRLRSTYGISILAVNHNGRFEINPKPEEKLKFGTEIIVIGSNHDIARLPVCNLSATNHSDHAVSQSAHS